MSGSDLPEDRRHLYDSVSSQKQTVIEGFAGQRETLMRAVEEQRLAAMPEEMRRMAGGQTAQVTHEIAEVLQAIIRREVTRQLDMAVCAMIERAAKTEPEPVSTTRVKRQKFRPLF